MSDRRIPALLAGLVALIVALTACGGGGGKHSIVLYNGQHPELTTALVSEFEKQTGISVRERSNDTAVLANQILEEGGGSPADVYLSENSPELMTLQERGLLAKLPRSVLSQVPARDRSPSGHWVGVALRVSSLVYNPKLLSRSELPRSVLDLAEPQWKGKIAISPADSDFPPVVGAVIARDGAAAAGDWLAGLKRNAQVYDDEEAVVAAVNRGAVAAGVINQYYWYRLRLELGAKRITSALYYFPGNDPGSVVNISGVAVLASSKHEADAQRFVAFLVGKQAQEIVTAGDDFEYPVRPGVAQNPAEPPLDRVAHASISAASLGDDKQAATLIQKSGLG
jgi:iron(III) transport system substrate-binding protein